MLAEDGIAYGPYFPLGGFSPLQGAGLKKVADDLGQSIQAVALAWLLQRSPNILLIPGTSSRSHLQDNISAASLVLDKAHLSQLDGLASN
jgi:aryl-alcohol dehydrogenase-like predicted oxidoreductase